MAYFEDETESPSTGHISIISGTHNPDNDRLRLGRELARDFRSRSFSSTSSRGSDRHENNNNKNNIGINNEDDSGTLDTFDISNDAAAMSTRRLDMLQQTPTIDTQLLDQFPDFSMAGRGIIEDSIEVGRGGNKGAADDSLRSVDFSSQLPFSIGGSTRKSDRKLFSNPDAGRKLSLSSTHSDPSEPLQASTRRGTAVHGKGKEKVRVGGQRLGSITNFDLSQIEISTPKNNRGRSGMVGSQGGTKITDFVSNSGSGGSRSRFADIQRSLEPNDEDSPSENGSVSARHRGFASSRFGGSPEPRRTAFNAAGAGKRISRQPETKNTDLTDDLPAIVAKARKHPAAKIPQNFKSTDVFLHELGLDGTNNTMDFKARLNQLKDVDGKGDNTTMAITQQSYLLPQMSDLSELISGYPGDATRMSHKRGPFNNTRGHMPIESIPIPHDERAFLMAMRLLQDKVTSLESSKADAEHRCMKLETELRKSETRIRIEQQRVRSAEENFTKKRSGDSAFGGSDDGDSQERAKEKQKLELQMEKLKLESTVNSLNSQVDKLTRDLEMAKIALKHMQEERNSAVNSVAIAIANNEDLKASMEELKKEIERLKMENHGQGIRDERERAEWKGREEKLRRKAKEAKESALLAQGVMMEAARRRDAATAAAMEAAEKETARVERREQRIREKEAQKETQKEQERAALEAQVRKEKEMEEKREQNRVIEQKKKLEKMIELQLKEIRPDLYIRSQPNPVGILTSDSNFVRNARSRKGKEHAITAPNRLKQQVTIEDLGDETVIPTPQEKTELPIGQENVVEQVLSEDTTVFISSEEIKRIAKEINAERKKRKAAAVAVNSVLEADAMEETRLKTQTRPKIKNSLSKSAVASSTRTQSAESSIEAAVVKKPQKAIKVDKGKAVAKPEELTLSLSSVMAKPLVSFDITQNQAQSQPLKKAKKTRLVKKVVFYYNEDTTQTIQLEREVEEEVSEDENEEELAAKSIHARTSQQEEEKGESEESGEEGLTAEFEEGLTQEYIRSATPTCPEAGITAEIARPRSPVIEDHTAVLPERMQRVVNHLAEHDPKKCTVCARMTKLQIQEHEQRMQNPLADIDNSMAIPAPSLKSVSRKNGAIRIVNGYEEEPTPRPSQVPKRQLSKVVRQLSDEFAHLKLNYQRKVEEFMNLNPTIGKRRRKTLTNEMNELAAEMDYKCDQIYALYDVNEEFINDFDDDGGEDGSKDPEEKEQHEIEVGRGEPDEEEEDEYDLTGFTIPEMSMIDESSEADDSEDEETTRVRR